MKRSVAVITIAHGRHDHLRRQHASLVHGTTRPDHHVVVAMADPGLLAWRPESAHELTPCVVSLDADEDLPLAAARNLGAETALDLGATTLVFLDVDCLAGPELVGAYDQVVQLHPATVWSGPVTYLPPGLNDARLAHAWLYDDPHPARPAPPPGVVLLNGDPNLFWSLSFSLDAGTWRDSGGFCEEYVGYGGEDTDFAYQACSRGLSFGWTGSARAYHQHHPTQSPPTDHLDDILRNAALFHRRWHTWPMSGWLREFESMGLVREEHGSWTRT